MKSAIEARGLRKTYPRGVIALDRLGSAVEAGAIFALLGPNGAGKSTTVILTTLSRPDEGEVRLARLDALRLDAAGGEQQLASPNAEHAGGDAR